MAYIIVGALAAIIDFKEPMDASAKYAENKKGSNRGQASLFLCLEMELDAEFRRDLGSNSPHVKGVTEHATIDIDAVRMLL